jgi:hypothetical protein
MKFFRHRPKATLLKSWPSGVGWGYNRGNCFTCVYIGKYFKKLQLRNHWTRKAEIYMELSYIVQKHVIKVMAPGYRVGSK